MDWLTDGGEVFSLACWQPFTPLKVSGTHFKETKLCNNKKARNTFKSSRTHTCEVVQSINASSNVLTWKRLTFIYIDLTHISYNEGKESIKVQ
jgi:hypothetical protein